MNIRDLRKVTFFDVEQRLSEQATDEERLLLLVKEACRGGMLQIIGRCPHDDDIDVIVRSLIEGYRAYAAQRAKGAAVLAEALNTPVNPVDAGPSPVDGICECEAIDLWKLAQELEDAYGVALDVWDATVARVAPRIAMVIRDGKLETFRNRPYRVIPDTDGLDPLTGDYPLLSDDETRDVERRANGLPPIEDE